MLKQLFVLTVLCAAVITIASAHDSGKGHKHHWGRGVNISMHDNEDSNSCEDQIEVSSDDLPSIVRSEEERTLPNQPLRVSASQNGGIQVRNWDKIEIGIKVCKVAIASNDAIAKSILDSIKLVADGNTISIDGPMKYNSDHDKTPAWTTLIMIFAPKGATLDLSAHNGGISLRNVDVNATARTMNGGIALNKTSGKMNLEAQNGGISLKDCGGDVTVEVQNGGVSIQLAQDWVGRGLDARTRNGGVVVEVPRDLRTSLEVTSEGHSSIICKSDACSGAQKTWDNDVRVLRFGSGGTSVIHASTVNGGIVIKPRGQGDYDDEL